MLLQRERYVLAAGLTALAVWFFRAIVYNRTRQLQDILTGGDAELRALEAKKQKMA